MTYLIAPERTHATLAATLATANAWFSRKGRVIAAVVAVGAGCYFMLKGVIGLV